MLLRSKIGYTDHTMYIQVKLLNGFREPLWYKIPEGWQRNNLYGSIVQVPVRTTIVPALVIAEQPTLPDVPFSIKDAHAPEQLPHDPDYYSFITDISTYYQLDQLFFFKRIKLFLREKADDSLIHTFPDQEYTAPQIQFTDEQQQAYAAIKPALIDPRYYPVVLHGVTGSGKTEIYKQLMLDTLSQGKSILFMLPEVTLALMFEMRIKKELGATFPIFGFHSATSPKEKKLLWQNLIDQKPMIIIGVHLPILLPIARLGLIIIDEEHEVGYQEKKHPRINSKEAAILRAQQYKIPIILGSATPSVTTLYNVAHKGWRFIQLKQRFAGAFPAVKTVYLTDKKQRRNFWISQELYTAIKDRLAKKEQTILFLNRRGFSFFVQCGHCSFIFICKNCSVSLTLHGEHSLVCHYCSYRKQLPPNCPTCTAHAQDFIKKGIGTQKIVSILTTIFPQARIARADLDTTRKKKQWQETLEAINQGTIDIIVGTQTITKGYDFPHVTLVGVIWADLNLHFPIFNASETALQQLIQVAGRAGRHHKQSLVIVQTMAPHTIFNYTNELDYLQYYEHELIGRKEIGYPPFKRLVAVELKHTNEGQVEKDALAIAHHLSTVRDQLNLSAQILGPAAPPVAKIQKIFTRTIYLKSPSMNTIIRLYSKITRERYKSSIYFSPNPVT